MSPTGTITRNKRIQCPSILGLCAGELEPARFRQPPRPRPGLRLARRVPRCSACRAGHRLPQVLIALDSHYRIAGHSEHLEQLTASTGGTEPKHNRAIL